MSGQGANTGARPQGAADALLGLSSGTIVNETSPSTLSTSASLQPASRMVATGAASSGATNGSNSTPHSPPRYPGGVWQQQDCDRWHKPSDVEWKLADDQSAPPSDAQQEGACPTARSCADTVL